MKRETKFRAWCNYRRAMIDWEILKNYPIQFLYSLTGEGNSIGMQYTGLKDKNGVGIYEGDIVETPNKPNLNLTVEWCKIHLCYLLEHENLHEIDTPRLTFFDRHIIEVIGNKYENPELLED